MKQIAFCFLIYDVINLEELWHRFFKDVDPAKYRIYIHYKINKPLKYFDKYKLTDCVETKYADVTLVRAHNVMFRHAYEDGCYKMINVSQACIPFKSFDYIYDFLTKDDLCHFNVSAQEVCFPTRCKRLLDYYPPHVINKSSEWFILNRTVCEIVINYPYEKIVEEYTTVYAPEEHYYITSVYHHNMLDQIHSTHDLANGATTFTNWKGMDYKYPSTYELKNYSHISLEELEHLVSSPCLFGRKFNLSCLASLCKPVYINAISSTPSK